MFTEEEYINAFRIAVNNRKNLESYYDLFEFDNINPEIIIDELKRNIYENNYSPQTSYVYYHPRKNGSPRSYFYLNIKDYILRCLLVNNIYKYFVDEVSEFFLNSNEIIGSFEFFKRRLQLANNFNKTQEKHLNKDCRYAAILDISNFYDSIDHDKLSEILSTKIDDSRFLHLFKKNSRTSFYDYILRTVVKKNIGLLTGNLTEDFLGHLYLLPLDKKLNEYKTIKHLRIVDDIRIFSYDSYDELEECIHSIKDVLGGLGLSLNESKTKIFDFSKHKNHCEDKKRDVNMFINEFDLLSDVFDWGEGIRIINIEGFKLSKWNTANFYSQILLCLSLFENYNKPIFKGSQTDDDGYYHFINHIRPEIIALTYQIIKTPNNNQFIYSLVSNVLINILNHASEAYSVIELEIDKDEYLFGNIQFADLVNIDSNILKLLEDFTINSFAKYCLIREYFNSRKWRDPKIMDVIKRNLTNSDIRLALICKYYSRNEV